MTTILAIRYIQLVVFVVAIAACVWMGREQLVDMDAVHKQWRKISDATIDWMDSHHVPHWHWPHAHASVGKRRG